MKCVIERLYKTICRDPETGEGGMTPTESDFHAPGFSRRDNINIRDAIKSAFDRLVQIEYQGTIEYQGFANGAGTSRRSKHEVLIRIGYYAGQSVNLTHMIMASDDKLIGTYIQKLDNVVGMCSSLCLEKIEYINSETIKVDEQRFELQILLSLQVY